LKKKGIARGLDESMPGIVVGGNCCGKEKSCSQYCPEAPERDVGYKSDEYHLSEGKNGVRRVGRTVVTEKKYRNA